MGLFAHINNEKRVIENCVTSVKTIGRRGRGGLRNTMLRIQRRRCSGITSRELTQNTMYRDKHRLERLLGKVHDDAARAAHPSLTIILRRLPKLFDSTSVIFSQVLSALIELEDIIINIYCKK